MMSKSLTGIDFFVRHRGAPGLRANLGNDGALTVWVYSPIVRSRSDADLWGGVAAEDFVQSVRNFEGNRIRIFMNSPGGDYFGAVAMAAALRESSASVDVRIDGIAASAATLLLPPAGRVSIVPEGRVMVHRAWTIAAGDSPEMSRVASMLDSIDADIAAGYGLMSGESPSVWIERMTAETWYDARAACRAGLCHEIAEGGEVAKSAASGAASEQLICSGGHNNIANARRRVRHRALALGV